MVRVAEAVRCGSWQTGDARPLVRSITCWALGRYAHFLAQRAQQPNGGLAQLDKVLQVTAPSHCSRSACVSDCSFDGWICMGSSGEVESLRCRASTCTWQVQHLQAHEEMLKWSQMALKAGRV